MTDRPRRLLGAQPLEAAQQSGSLLRRTTVCALLGIGKSKIHDDVRRRLLPPPLKMSPRHARWVSGEIAAVVDARIEGKSDEAVKKLVSEIVALRSRKGHLDA